MPNLIKLYSIRQLLKTFYYSNILSGQTRSDQVHVVDKIVKRWRWLSVFVDLWLDVSLDHLGPKSQNVMLFKSYRLIKFKLISIWNFVLLEGLSRDETEELDDEEVIDFAKFFYFLDKPLVLQIGWFTVGTPFALLEGNPPDVWTEVPRPFDGAAEAQRTGFLQYNFGLKSKFKKIVQLPMCSYIIRLTFLKI